MIIPRRIYVTQMERYGSYDEQTYRNTFKKEVDWKSINLWIVNEYFPKTDRKAIAIDPSNILKSGKHTAHIGRFWSGCVQQAKHGLEILGIGVIDIDKDPSPCLAFYAEQTPNSTELKAKNMTLDMFYLYIIEKLKEQLLSISKYIFADARFSKRLFANGITDMGFHLISRFRNDANLHYVYQGECTGKRGRPRVLDGKINYDNLDYSRMSEFEVSGETDKFYSLVAYSKALKRKVSLVIRVMDNGKHKLYFSTDAELSGKDVMEYYRGRFLVEFVFRYCKQYADLCLCQARCEEKLNFGFNTSLTSVNIAKLITTVPLKWTNCSLKLLKYSLLQAVLRVNGLDFVTLQP